MRKEDFAEVFGDINEKHIAEARAERKAKKPVWIKWGAMAACLCLVAAGAFVMPGVWNSSNTPISNPTGTIQREDELETYPDQPILRPGDGGYIEPGIETPIGDTHNGVMIGGPFNNQDFLPGKPMISNYGEMASEIDMAVNNGHLHISKALKAAMENYGENANYRVLIMLFRDGAHISSGEALALEEAKRLSELGYIVAMETYTEEEDHGEYVSATKTYYFTLHATYEQLKDFTASDNLGYSMMLYDEYFGETELSETVVFSGSIQSNN